ncbi:hypothetical protein HYH03_004823 [Edaphochlamys debaryana]|uniref:EF-hand domain-containing protein n=1 Tax=Edaphochlamys debaryana TaxID=47281 RepID=A0A835Y8T0_9CHLO|nr:hypothetical protein HYH03_004823 [Edaphochlamys debaryana]|eukprot:KAG2497234.1 hypothetical protein HYH03_004823 [Edaphochlamys debaryana]
MDELLRSAHTLLEKAERRVGDYCSTFATTSDGQPVLASVEIATLEEADPSAPPPARRCWHVYRSLNEERRRLEAATAASAAAKAGDGAADGAAATAAREFDRAEALATAEALEKLIRELQYAPANEMVSVLAANERRLGSVAGRRRKGAENAPIPPALETPPQPSTPSPKHPTSTSTSTSSTSTSPITSSGTGTGERLSVVEGLTREQAAGVFKKLDRSGRGWLDGDDLLAGLDTLGQHLDLSDVEQICRQMGTMGRVDLQAFSDIVEAQRLAVPGSDSVFLRHVRHAQPEWWTDAPGYLDRSQ